MTELGHILGFNNPDDWYPVNRKHYLENGGGGILDHFNGSKVKPLYELYPNFEFEPWLFDSVPNGTWNDICNIRKYLQWFSNKKGFVCDDVHGWAKISADDIKAERGGGLIYNKQWNGDVVKLVSAAFPDMAYDTIKRLDIHDKPSIGWNISCVGME